MSKILSPTEFTAKKIKKKIVMCHGVFDILHIGHIKHFEEAKKYGELLVVGITTDKFINKGPNRPFFKLNQRAEAIESLSVVDYVIVSNFPTATELIKKIRPHFYCKGLDFKKISDDLTLNIKKEISAVKSVGGKFITTKSNKLSSTDIFKEYFEAHNINEKKFLTKVRKKYNFKSVQKIFDKLSKLNCLVVGEAMIDQYSFCEPVNKSGKDPMLVFRDLYLKTYLGGSLAIANHVSKFAKTVSILTDIGDRSKFKNFIKQNLSANVNLNLINKFDSETIVKKRYIDAISNTKVFGLYKIDEKKYNNIQELKFQKKIKKIINKFEFVILSDYGHGLISDQVAKILTKKSKFLIVNCQINSFNVGFHRLSKYKNFDCLIVNENELRFDCRDKYSKIESLITQKSKELKVKFLIVTRGKDGAIFYSRKNNKFFYAPAFAKIALDKIGAGDTMMALLAPLLYLKLDPDFILLIASLAGSFSVGNYANSKILDKQKMLKDLQHILD